MAMTPTEKRIYYEESMKRKTPEQKKMEEENDRLRKLRSQYKRHLR